MSCWEAEEKARGGGWRREERRRSWEQQSGSRVPGTNCPPAAQRGSVTPAKACNVSHIQLSSCLYDLQLSTWRARYRFTWGQMTVHREKGWGCWQSLLLRVRSFCGCAAGFGVMHGEGQLHSEPSHAVPSVCISIPFPMCSVLMALGH